MKASKAIRRGTVRLRSTLGSGHTSLNLVISEQSNVRQKHKDLVTAEISAAQTLHKWSQSEDSPALQDILHQVSELSVMWGEAEKDFIAARKEFKRKFEQILEMEKRLDQAKKNLVSCEDRERKIQKELVKGPKDPSAAQERLRQATDAKALADAEVSGQKRETEAMKLLSIRAGLLDQSSAMNTLAKKCSMLAECQKELAVLIPESNARSQDLPTYAGARQSSQIMRTAHSRFNELQPPSYSAGVATSNSSSIPRPSSASVHTTSSFRPRSYSEPELAIGDECDSFDSFDSD